MLQPAIEPAVHLRRILEAIDELQVLQERTAAPATMPHQYIGTVVDNTIALLTAPANALDGGGRQVAFTEPGNWLSLMQAVHRSFFSSLQLAIEAGLAHTCQERGVRVHSQQRAGMEAVLAIIEEASGSVEAVSKGVSRLRAHFRTYRPVFRDYLESVLASPALPRRGKTQWRRFFQALSTVRNKASHADPSLTDHERQTLRDGGCGAMISESGELVLNPRMYAQAADFALRFLDVVQGSPHACGGNPP